MCTTAIVSQSEVSGRPMRLTRGCPSRCLIRGVTGSPPTSTVSISNPFFPGVIRGFGRRDSNTLAGRVVLEYWRWPPRTFSISRCGSAWLGVHLGARPGRDSATAAIGGWFLLGGMIG